MIQKSWQQKRIGANGAHASRTRHRRPNPLFLQPVNEAWLVVFTGIAKVNGPVTRPLLDLVSILSDLPYVEALVGGCPMPVGMKLKIDAVL